VATVNRAKSKGNIQVRQNLVDLDLYNNEKWKWRLINVYLNKPLVSAMMIV
jgi:hypothetical protein